MGYIRIQDLSSILKEYQIKPVDIVFKNHKRNPWRVLPIEKAEQESYDTNEGGGDNDSQGDIPEYDFSPLLKEG